MSGTPVKCLTEPCVTKCPDAKMVIHPPPLAITLPGLRLTTNPGKCLVETQTSCPINGEEGSCKAVVTKSSGLRAISGGDTPCCTTACSDSQLVIYPPPVCIMLPGAMLSSNPNECLIESSIPCVPSETHPLALTRSASNSDCSVLPQRTTRSTSVPCGLPSDNPCVTQGPGSKVIIHPPEIEICLPGPIVEIMAAECAVEVYNPCDGNAAITGEEQCAITNGDEDTGETKALATRVKDSATICALLGASSCISEGPELRIVVKPPPLEVDMPGPILQVFPETCKVEVLNPGGSETPALDSSKPYALCNNEITPSRALATRRSSLCAMKQPLPDLRRPSRPWGEIYGRSVLSRSTINQLSRYSKYHNGFSSTSNTSSMSYRPSY
nr:uncharacterized protein LOC132764218 [Anolis sagrei ordinatus]XP_060614096.1 uncharacterized protein LOC132764218 [Anolis sagrei ordinatus]XP_060614097.1 uncharacterized protein LOC132764218 [Anolis sagrei ordinatus]